MQRITCLNIQKTQAYCKGKWTCVHVLILQYVFIVEFGRTTLKTTKKKKTMYFII